MYNCAAEIYSRQGNPFQQCGFLKAREISMRILLPRAFVGHEHGSELQ